LSEREGSVAAGEAQDRDGLSPPRSTSAGRPRGLRGLRGLSPGLRGLADRYGLLIAWAIVIAVFAVVEPDTFFTFANLHIILGTQAVLLILALALLLPLTVGEFDLSVTGALSVALVLIGYLNVQHRWPILGAVAVALLSGVLIGLVNTFFVMVVGVESIVVTLGTGTMWLGVGYGINAVNISGISAGLVSLTRDDLLGVPLAFWYGLLLTLALFYLYAFTPLGRYLYFVGANRQVSRLSGIPVGMIRAGALMASAIISSLAGVVLAGVIGGAGPTIANGYLLPAFAAVFLGATAINPGRFNPWGTFIAVFFLITGITGLELLGFTGWVENAFYGASLVLAVALSRLAARRRVA
jgi:ribose transport system permease protein